MKPSIIQVKSELIYIQNPYLTKKQFLILNLWEITGKKSHQGGNATMVGNLSNQGFKGQRGKKQSRKGAQLKNETEKANKIKAETEFDQKTTRKFVLPEMQKNRTRQS